MHPRRHRHHRIPRLRRDLVALRHIRRHQQRVDGGAVVGQRGVDAVLPGGGLAERERLVVGFVHDAAGGEGGEEAVLAAAEGGVEGGKAAFGAGVGEVEGDDVGEGADARVGELGEVGGDVVVEVDFDVGVLAFVGVAARAAVVPVPAGGGDDGLVGGKLGVVDYGCAGGGDQRDEREEDRLLFGVGERPEGGPGEAEARAFERGLVGYVWDVATDRGLSYLRGGVVVPRIDSVDRIKRIHRIPHCPPKTSNCVLVSTLRDHPRSARQPHRRLDPHDRVPFRWIDHAPICLRPQRKRYDIVCHCNCAPGTTASGVDGEVVRAARLPAPRRVAFAVVVRSHVRPFAEGRFAEEDGAGLAQLGYYEGVAGDDGAEQGEAAGGCFELVFGGDVVLYEEGDAVEGAAHAVVGAFGVESCGDGEDVGVQLEDGAWTKSASGSLGDARLGQLEDARLGHLWAGLLTRHT